jgi:hypothetical protein
MKHDHALPDLVVAEVFDRVGHVARLANMRTHFSSTSGLAALLTKHAARLKAMYGSPAIREIYGATEGMFGRQLDERRARVPNYDLFFSIYTLHPDTGLMSTTKRRRHKASRQ